MTFPFGYAGSPQGMGTQLTIAQYETMQTVRLLNFEFWRRVKGLMEYAAARGVPLGVGTGWRVQPSNPGPGFAQPGNSNHEGFPADGRSGGAVAADMVPSTSWGWMGANCALFGLRTFEHVNNEPWHIQPIEIPAARNFRKAPWVLQPWSFPGPPTPTPPPLPGPIPQMEDIMLWARFEGDPTQPLEVAWGAQGWRRLSDNARAIMMVTGVLKGDPKTGGAFPAILPIEWKSRFPETGPPIL